VSAYAHGQFVGEDVLNCLIRIMNNIDLTEANPLKSELLPPILTYASIFSVQSVALLGNEGQIVHSNGREYGYVGS
jgi:hypothetical protein